MKEDDEQTPQDDQHVNIGRGLTFVKNKTRRDEWMIVHGEKHVAITEARIYSKGFINILRLRGFTQKGKWNNALLYTDNIFYLTGLLAWKFNDIALNHTKAGFKTLLQTLYCENQQTKDWAMYTLKQVRIFTKTKSTRLREPILS